LHLSPASDDLRCSGGYTPGQVNSLLGAEVFDQRLPHDLAPFGYYL